jgi:hypothetical protein
METMEAFRRRFEGFVGKLDGVMNETTFIWKQALL